MLGLLSEGSKGLIQKRQVKPNKLSDDELIHQYAIK